MFILGDVVICAKFIYIHLQMVVISRRINVVIKKHTVSYLHRLACSCQTVKYL